MGFLGLGNITKMFSESLFGKFFDSIGMPWMNNILSLATNVATGNWLAAAKDVFDLVSQFSNNNSWMNRVAQLPPVGPFATNEGFGRGCMTQSRADELRTQVQSDDPRLTRNSSRVIFIAHETRYNNTVANDRLREANAQLRV